MEMRYPNILKTFNLIVMLIFSPFLVADETHQHDVETAKQVINDTSN